VLGYLLTHMPRNLSTQVAILDALDAYALAAKRAITVPLVREWAAQAQA
jgi:DnaA family protein